jgi:hypothetical protein
VPRMIFDVPLEIQIAIRIRAAKAQKTTGEVVAEAIESTFPVDMVQAREAEKENQRG